jgi:hypothetical protein
MRMMTKDEALKMAIEALEEAKDQIGGLPALDKLIQDCKEALEHSNQWISVEDRLPDYGVDVIAMEADGRVYRLSRREHSQYFWDAYKYYYTKVIFWMPFTPPIDQAKE